jgi:hypothetical protein
LGNSGDGGDENPPKGNIGKTHISPVALKRKRDVTQKGEKEIPVPEPEDMEVDVEEEELDWATQILLENREITQELACQEPLIFRRNLSHCTTTFNKESKKLLIEKINLKNKKVVEKWNSEIDLQGVKPSKVMQFHEATEKHSSPQLMKLK